MSLFSWEMRYPRVNWPSDRLSTSFSYFWTVDDYKGNSFPPRSRLTTIEVVSIRFCEQESINIWHPGKKSVKLGRSGGMHARAWFLPLLVSRRLLWKATQDTARHREEWTRKGRLHCQLRTVAVIKKANEINKADEMLIRLQTLSFLG